MPAVQLAHVDKVVHFLLYAVLGVLLARALRIHAARFGDGDRRLARMVLLAIVTVAAFAAADEWHQRFVPGRSSDVLDWCADLAGGTLALLLATRANARPEHLT